VGVILREIRGQAALEAMVSLAALFAALALLLHAALGVAGNARGLAHSGECRLEAGTLAFGVNQRALETRGTTFSQIELRGCVLRGNAAVCCNGGAEEKMLANASGGTTYAFAPSLPV